MFDHFLASVVVIPPLSVIAARVAAGCLAPGLAAGVLAWAAAGTAIASTVNLIVLTLTAVAGIPAAGDVFGRPARVVAGDTAHVPWMSWVSAVLLAMATAAIIAVRQRQRRLLSQAGAGEVPAGRLIVVVHPAPRAFAVPGRPGHIVVTTGMRDALSAGQFDALLAHEQAHLTGRHHRLIQLCELAAAAHPALWWVARRVDYLVERAADEQAAVQIGCRRTVAHAICAAALASAGTAPPPRGLNAVSPGGVVPRRVACLLRPRYATITPVPAILPLGLAALSLIWTGGAVYELGELVAGALRGR